MTRWEYEVMRPSLTFSKDRLNEFGAEGWELVCMRNMQSFAGGIEYVFKRPKESNEH